MVFVQFGFMLGEALISIRIRSASLFQNAVRSDLFAMVLVFISEKSSRNWTDCRENRAKLPTCSACLRQHALSHKSNKDLESSL